MKKCRFCAEMIQNEAIKCRYCGEMIQAVDYSEEKVLIEKNPAWRGYSKQLFSAVFFIVCGGYPLIVLETHPEWRTYSNPVIQSILAVVITLGLIAYAYVYLDRMGKRYTMTSSRLIVRRGLLSKKIDEINIRDIRNMNTSQGFMDRIFNCGDLFIGTAGTADHEIVIKAIKGPVEFKDAIAQHQSLILMKG